MASGIGMDDHSPAKKQKTIHATGDTRENLGDDKWIDDIARNIGKDFHAIAIQLGYEGCQVDKAEMVYPKRPDKMIFEILRKWWDASKKIICDENKTANFMAKCFSQHNEMVARMISEDYEDPQLHKEVLKKVEESVRQISFDKPEAVILLDSVDVHQSKEGMHIGKLKMTDTIQSQNVAKQHVEMKGKKEDQRDIRKSNSSAQNTNQSPMAWEQTVSGSQTEAHICGVIKLRDYQKELAEDALSGRNSIIFSKTGSGKTHIAAYIMKDHLNKRVDGKIVFMAPSNVLAQQQYGRLCDMLPAYKTHIYLACGDSAGNDAQMQNLSLMMEKTRVFVITPQILENNFYYEWIPSIGSFTMLVFDECHHTQKREPYNMIMKRYRKLKISGKTCVLPQIIGLTASLCSDKPNSVHEAKCGIQSLMARMDVYKISTVKINTREYNASGHVGKHEQMMLKSRDGDPTGTAVTEALVQIEKIVKRSQADVWGRDIRNLLKRVPPERGSQQYFSWVDELEKKARQNLDKPFEEAKAKFVLTCCEYMKIYNEALARNVTLPVRSVEEYLYKTYMDTLKMKETSYMYDDRQRGLLETFQEIRHKIQDLADNNTSENPNIAELRKKLNDLLERNENAKFMIFVKTRASTEAVASYLTDIGIECKSLTGSGASSQDVGLTKTEQKKIMDEFRSGDISGLIATVGDEGLDFPDCELIIQYDIVGSATTSVQMKGRSRKGDTLLFAGKEKLEKEVRNIATIEMMKEALQSLEEEGVMEQSIENEMAEIVKQEDLEDFIIEKKKQSKQEKCFEVFCKSCNDFVVSGENIRCFKDNHYVIVDEEYTSRIKTEKIEKEINVEDLVITEKVFGKRCGMWWGHQAIVNSRPYPLLAVKQVRFVDETTHESKTYKKWIDVPYIIRKLELNISQIEANSSA